MGPSRTLAAWAWLVSAVSSTATRVTMAARSAAHPAKARHNVSRMVDRFISVSPFGGVSISMRGRLTRTAVNPLAFLGRRALRR
jgi:hypothetical protein